jgi:hypothetical protein
MTITSRSIGLTMKNEYKALVEMASVFAKATP